MELTKGLSSPANSSVLTAQFKARNALNGHSPDDGPPPPPLRLSLSIAFGNSNSWARLCPKLKLCYKIGATFQLW